MSVNLRVPKRVAIELGLFDTTVKFAFIKYERVKYSLENAYAPNAPLLFGQAVRVMHLVEVLPKTEDGR